MTRKIKKMNSAKIRSNPNKLLHLHMITFTCMSVSMYTGGRPINSIQEKFFEHHESDIRLDPVHTQNPESI